MGSTCTTNTTAAFTPESSKTILNMDIEYLNKFRVAQVLSPISHDMVNEWNETCVIPSNAVKLARWIIDTVYKETLISDKASLIIEVLKLCHQTGVWLDVIVPNPLIQFKIKCSCTRVYNEAKKLKFNRHLKQKLMAFARFTLDRIKTIEKVRKK